MLAPRPSPLAPYRPIANWLFLCAALVAAMVILGGYTRLSGSGLSITEWKPIHGVIPPLSQGEWEEEFAGYRQIPQFSQVNSDMDVEGFKAIFWPEYLHRLLGRMIGLVFFVPLVWFAARRKITPKFALRLTAIFALGGAQGVLGWYMVSSGLAENSYVSHLRLAAHLALAFLLLALLLWAALDAIQFVIPNVSEGSRSSPGTQEIPHFVRDDKKFLWILLALLSIQTILGAFLAGLHGGLIYNSFPTMNGAWVPPDLLARKPWWDNWLENISTIQFTHRWLGKILAVSYVFWWFSTRKDGINNLLGKVPTMMMLAVLLQFALGVATLVYQVPLALALAHQFTALVLFSLTVTAVHGLKTPRPVPVPVKTRRG